MIFQELNGDQRRESVNSRQRYAAWKDAVDELERAAAKAESEDGRRVWQGREAEDQQTVEDAVRVNNSSVGFMDGKQAEKCVVYSQRTV